MRSLMLGTLFFLTLTACGSNDSENTPDPKTSGTTAGQVSAETVVDPVAEGVDSINEASYRRHVEILASDEFGGRAPGSQGEELTVAYLVDNFKNMGLEPANDGSYIQAVPLSVNEVVNKPALNIRDAEGESMALAYATEQVMWTRQQVPEIKLDDSEMVFVGYGINAPERGWNDYEGIDVRGKTVVILINDPGFATQDPDLFNGNAMTYYGRWDYKFNEAASQGASGAIMVHDRLPAAYGWNTVINSWTGPKFAMVLPNKGEDLASVESWLSYDSAVALFNRAGLDLENLYSQAQKPGFKAIPLGLTASAELVNEVETIDSRNVAAILPGSEAPDEIFIYMAHWDHFGTDPKLEGDQIYNGALDNASGTAALLEIAKAYATMPQTPRRSILFLAVTAEEQGLLGSLYYAANPLFPLSSTVGGLNMDGMNNFGSTRDITVIGLGMSDLDDYLAAAAAEQERVMAADREAEKGYYFRSDHFELAKEGVPMLFPSGGYDDREKGVAYGMEKAEEYTEDHYHRVTDEYNLSWNVSGALEDMEMYFKTGLDVANSSHWPNWKEGSEFKAARDAQMEDKQ
jgi:Zn-dependent M28 family amino/carboxypeptidase